MEKFANDAQYDNVVSAAKAFGINYIGKKKTVLIEMINAKIDAGETIQTAAPVDQETETTSETSEGQAPAAAAGQQPAAPAAQPTGRRGRQTSTQPRQPRAKKAKWFTEEGANLPYNVGDIIEITGGDILVGRKAQFTRYSSKQDAVKCILIHPVKGTLQNCEITMDFWKIKKADDQTSPVAVDETAETPAVSASEQPSGEKEGQDPVVVTDEQPEVNPEAGDQGKENNEESLA